MRISESQADRLLESASSNRKAQRSMFQSPAGALEALLGREAPSSEGKAGGGLDRLELSGTRSSLLEVSLQLHVERTVMDETGRVLGRETLDISIQYQRAEIESSGEPAEEGDLEEAQPSAMDRLMEHFSPENTAQRIMDFLSRGFQRTSFGEKDTAESRQGFIDFILPFVRQGVDEALEMFGKLPDEVRARAEETYDRTAQLLNEFAGGGNA